MTMLPTFLAGTNFVMHSAGWLEGGLVSCYEKFIVDIEILRMLKHEFKPLEVTEESLAFDAHEEVGSGGHFLGAAHTLMHFRDCFYRPLLSSTDNFDRWTKNGGQDAAARAGNIWRETLDEYEQPPIDERCATTCATTWRGGGSSWGTSRSPPPPSSAANSSTPTSSGAPPSREGVLRRGHRRRRRARARDRVLPREEPRHHERRRARARLARRRQHGPQHDGHPLELPVGRERGDLRARAEALGGARGGARLRHDVQPARRPQPRAQPRRRARGRRRVHANQLNGVDAVWLDPDGVEEVCPIVDISPTSATRCSARPCSRAAASRATTTSRGATRAARTRSASTSSRTARSPGFCVDGGRVVGVETHAGTIRAGARRRSPRRATRRVLAAMAGLRLPIQSHPLQALVSELLEPFLHTRGHVRTRSTCT